MKTKLDTNITILIYYTKVLPYMFRPFLAHHQASHKSIDLSFLYLVILIWRRVIVQAVSIRLSTAATRVRAQVVWDLWWTK
jgi:hypothetical protein